MASKRRFGRVRRLPSGRFQARYHGPDGIDRPVAQTFCDQEGRRGLAHSAGGRDPCRQLGGPGSWQGRVRSLRTSMAGGSRSQAADGRAIRRAAVQSPDPVFRQLRTGGDPRTARAPLAQGAARNRRNSEAQVWRRDRSQGVSAPALDSCDSGGDKAIKRNPCRIKGAGEEHSPERPVVELPDLAQANQLVADFNGGVVDPG
jgi:hypothetical protein